MKKLWIAALMSCAIGSAAFVNGNFSSGSTGWTTQPLPGGSATFSVVSFNTVESLVSNAMSADINSLIAGERRGGQILQTLTLGPGTYNITADIASFGRLGFFSTLMDLGLVQLIANGIELDSHDFGSFAIQPIVVPIDPELEFEIPVVVALAETRRAQLSGNLVLAAQTDVDFRFVFSTSELGGASNSTTTTILPTRITHYIDNIAIREVVDQSVPEPATVGLVFSCIGAIWLHRRRK